MKTFYLSERPDGRVVVSTKPEPEWTFIRSLRAETLKDAYKLVPYGEFFHDPGHGYFITPRQGAYQRATAAAARVEAERARLAKIIGELDPPKRGGNAEQKNRSSGKGAAFTF